MASRPWEALAGEAVRLDPTDPSYRWLLGDLCVEAIPPGTGRAERSSNQRQLEVFARRTGLALGLLKDCYRTSSSWPRGKRIPGISHSRHSTVASRPNRVDLLLNDEMDDGMTGRVRERVHKVEELLGEPGTRSAFVDRSRSRSRSIVTAARALADEDLAKARTNQRLEEINARALLAEPEIRATMAERAIKANVALAKMLTELIDLAGVASQIPPSYHDRTADHLAQIENAAERILTVLRPATRSPQPGNAIDLSVEGQSGAEHR